MKRLTLTLAALAVAPGLMAGTLLDKAADRKLDGPTRAVPGQRYEKPRNFRPGSWIMALRVEGGWVPVHPYKYGGGFDSFEACKYAAEVTADMNNITYAPHFPICVMYDVKGD